MKKDNKSRLHNQLHTKSTNIFSQTHKPRQNQKPVKMFIAILKASDGYKRNLCIAYNKYCKFYRSMENAKIQTRSQEHRITNQRKNTNAHSQRWKTSINKTATKHGNRTKTRRTSKTQSQRPRPRPQNSQPNNSQKRQPKNHTNVTKPNTETPRTHHREQPNPNDLLFKGTDSDHYGKQYRKMRNKLADKLKDPTIRQHTTLRPKTLLLHKETKRHRKPLHRNGSNGSHKTHNNPTIHAPTQPQRRRMDMHRSNNSQRSNQTHRKRIPIRHNNRRNTTIQKTQINTNILFFYSVSCLTVMSRSHVARAPTHKNSEQQPARVLCALNQLFGFINDESQYCKHSACNKSVIRKYFCT